MVIRRPHHQPNIHSLYSAISLWYSRSEFTAARQFQFIFTSYKCPRKEARSNAGSQVHRQISSRPCFHASCELGVSEGFLLSHGTHTPVGLRWSLVHTWGEPNHHSVLWCNYGDSSTSATHMVVLVGFQTLHNLLPNTSYEINCSEINSLRTNPTRSTPVTSTFHEFNSHWNCRILCAEGKQPWHFISWELISWA